MISFLLVVFFPILIILTMLALGFWIATMFSEYADTSEKVFFFILLLIVIFCDCIYFAVATSPSQPQLQVHRCGRHGSATMVYPNGGTK